MDLSLAGLHAVVAVVEAVAAAAAAEAAACNHNSCHN